MKFDIKTICDVQGFNELVGNWDELNNFSEAGNIFLSYTWMREWWNIYAQKKDKLYIIAFYKNQNLVAICPFYIQYLATGLILRFIGTGEPESEEVYSEFLDVLCLKEYESDVIREVYNHLNNLYGNFQFVIFNRILEKSLVFNLSNLLSKDYYSKINHNGLRYYLKLLNKSWKGYLSKIPSKSFKNKLKRCQNHFFQLPSSKYIVFNEVSKIQKVYPNLIDLHQKSWVKKGHRGVFCSSQFNLFHQNIIKHHVDSNSVYFLVVEVEENVIAVFYFLIDKNCCYYYQSGIDREFKPNVSPGYLGHALMIQYCIEHNIKYYDFMMGSSYSYKSKFNPETERVFDIFMVERNLFGTFIFFKWTLQKLKKYLLVFLKVNK